MSVKRKYFFDIKGAEWVDYLSTTMLSAMNNIVRASTIKNDEYAISVRYNGLYIKPKASFTAEELNIHPSTLAALRRRNLISVDPDNDTVSLTYYGKHVLTELRKEL